MTRVILLSPVWRLVTAALAAIALVTLPTYVLALVLLEPVPPIVMERSFALGTVLPALVAWGIARAFRGEMSARDDGLRIARADVTLDVRASAIAAVRPWWLPLPQPGLRLLLAAGGPVPFRPAGRTLAGALDALDAAGVDTTVARRHPTVVWAATRRPWSPGELLLKFGVLTALPASVLFYTHQHIAYGGTFGQWYLEGPRAWWTTFAHYWATTAVLLVSYASFWRAGAEVVVWLVAAIAPATAVVVRRMAEAICAIAYYAGVPMLLALRYLSP
jgi:apolipoprotein N-acyltransferase